MESFDEESMQALKRELRELRRAGEESKMEHRRQLFKLRSDLAFLRKTLHDKISCSRATLYQQAIRDVFLGSSIGETENGSESCSLLPQPYVIKIQAQLCHSLQSNEIQKKQLKILEHRKKSQIKQMEKRKEELAGKNKDRKMVLDQRLVERTVEWQNQVEELQLTVEAQEMTIKELRKHLKVLDDPHIPLSMHESDSNVPSPRSSVSSFSTSMRKMMEGVSIFEMKSSVALTSLVEAARNSPQVFKPKLWLDPRKHAMTHKQLLEQSFAELQGLQGPVIRSDWSKHSFNNHSSSIGSYLNEEKIVDSLVNRSVESIEKVDCSAKPNRNAFVKNARLHKDKEYSGSESLTIIEDSAFDTPSGERNRLSGTDMGKSLLTVVERDIATLSPTTKTVQDLPL
jgi:hypothetical protein